MLFTKRSAATGKVHTLDVPCTQAQVDAWHNGQHIQTAMPDVPADLREFLISGTTPAEWAALFGNDPE